MGERGSPVDRDRRIVRRALLAGAVVWAVLASVLIGAVLVTGGGGGQGAAAVLLALCIASAVSSLWLLLALVLDAFARERVGPRRLWWTAAAVVLTLLSPVLALGARG